LSSQKFRYFFGDESVSVTGANFQKKSVEILALSENGQKKCPFLKMAFENRKKSWMLALSCFLIYIKKGFKAGRGGLARQAWHPKNVVFVFKIGFIKNQWISK
jgi:hypothetical protein